MPTSANELGSQGLNAAIQRRPAAFLTWLGRLIFGWKLVDNLSDSLAERAVATIEVASEGDTKLGPQDWRGMRAAAKGEPGLNREVGELARDLRVVSLFAGNAKDGSVLENLDRLKLDQPL